MTTPRPIPRVRCATAARRLGAQLRELERREPGQRSRPPRALAGRGRHGGVPHARVPPERSVVSTVGIAVAMASPLGGATGATVSTGTAPFESPAAKPCMRAHAAGVPNPNAESRRRAEQALRLHRERKRRAAYRRWSSSRRSGRPRRHRACGRHRETWSAALHGDAAGLNGHSSIVTDDSALRATRAAIEGKPLPCQSLASDVDRRDRLDRDRHRRTANR